MSYTVGIKRRFWFAKKYSVKAHSWNGPKLILNLTDGSQIAVPGLSTLLVQVYPDFWDHKKKIEEQKIAAEIQAQEEEKRFQERLESERRMLMRAPPPAERLAAPGPHSEYAAPEQPPLAATEAPRMPQPDPEEIPPGVDAPRGPTISEEARRNAAERVRGVLQSDEFGGPGINPH